MNRLTNKKIINLKDGEFLALSKEEYSKQVHEAPTYKEIYTKLGQLEDLEDQLGCPLEVVFKALKEGIYKKDEDIIFEATLRIYNGEAYLYQPYDDRLLHKVLLKYYGKTWWLKSDRSDTNE